MEWWHPVIGIAGTAYLGVNGWALLLLIKLHIYLARKDEQDRQRDKVLKKHEERFSRMGFQSAGSLRPVKGSGS